jgi:predicted TIM-barrel fold metal-dependent hydrolase
VIIDVHGHITHPDVLARYPAPPSLGEIDGIIEAKAEAGIDISILGSPAGAGPLRPVTDFDHYNQSQDQLKGFHDWLAEVVAAHKYRLRAYAYCNPFADDQILSYTAEAVRDQGFVGIISNTSVRGEYLDSPRADGFFAMIAEADVPVLLHPGSEPACCSGLRDYGLVEMVGRYCDITMSLCGLVLSDRLEKYPKIRIIGASGGGALSQLTSRLDMAQRATHWKPRSEWAPDTTKPVDAPHPSKLQAEREDCETSRKPSELARQLFVDTTGDSIQAHLSNHTVLGPQQILFGTDSPPLPVVYRDKVRSITSLPVADEDRQAILSDNAIRLFRLYDLVTPPAGKPREAGH